MSKAAMTHWVVVIPVTDPIYYVSYPKHPTLQELQGLVEGMIEIVQCSGIEDGTLLVNEEGLLHKLPYNEVASSMADQPIVGPAVYCLFSLE